MPGPGSRSSIWAPQRIQRIWMPASFIERNLTAKPAPADKQRPVELRSSRDSRGRPRRRPIVGRYRASRAPIVRPTSGARHGHPLLIDRSLFAALRAADPATGAKPIVRAHASAAGDLAIDDEGAFIDIDTEEEYRTRVSGPSGGDAAPRRLPE